MSLAIELLADSADAELAGAPGTSGDGPVVALGDVSSDGSRPLVRWLDRPTRPDDGESKLMIAPAGEGLWRRAPWPAADALFDLQAAAGGAAPPAPALLVGAERGLREAVAARAAERGVALQQAERLDAARLGSADCIVMAESPGGALPARAFAVLAAGRLLITPRLETTFGLEDGLDHLEFAAPDEAVDAVRAFAAAPETFGRVVSWARLKAEQQRASVVYARLAEDLRLQRLVAGA